MPPQPPESPASARRPRRAAASVARTFGAGTFPDGVVADGSRLDGSLTDRSHPDGSHPDRSHRDRSEPDRSLADRSRPLADRYVADQYVANAGTTGRHRRPESLEDHISLRAAPGAPGPNGRFAGGRSESGNGLSFPRDRGSAMAHRADVMGHTAERGDSADPRPSVDRRLGFDWRQSADPARGPDRGRMATWVNEMARGRRSSVARSRRGKHAKPSEPLTFAALPLPAVRDVLPAMRNTLPVVRDALPAVRDVLSEGRRAAGAFRDWALYTDGQQPVTGSHRAPGTLPIESWLLIGKQRQQALLATLVAAGLVLIMIPVQRGSDANPVNAAEHGFASTGSSQKAGNKAPDATSKSPRQPTTPGKPAPGQPAPAHPTAAPPAAPAGSGLAADPTIAVPHGSGPAQSLRRTGSDTIALTFDDGPDPVQTPKILALLAKYDIKATFCLIGQNVEKHPEIVQQIVAAGHTLCNHTWNHSFTIGERTPAAIRADLEKTDAAIRAAVPDAQIPFFRAPGGYFTDRLVSVAYEEGMASLYWEVDPRDWDHSTDPDDTAHTDRVIATVQKEVRPGSIVLSHDYNQPDTIAAYEKLLPWLTQNFEIGMPVPPPPPAPDSPTPSSPPAASPASETSDEPQ
jgi:peptidoglycan-N-acetylglucosamine deacetylase